MARANGEKTKTQQMIDFLKEQPNENKQSYENYLMWSGEKKKDVSKSTFMERRSRARHRIVLETKKNKSQTVSPNTKVSEKNHSSDQQSPETHLSHPSNKKPPKKLVTPNPVYEILWSGSSEEFDNLYSTFVEVIENNYDVVLVQKRSETISHIEVRRPLIEGE